jgi:glycosyltransferase involved in cell wall biosynthesis
MRIAWVTPLSQKSAIGHVTVRVAEQLRHLAEVELWYADRDPIIQTQVPVVRFSLSSSFERWLAGYDTVLYNFGNSLFHRDVFPMSQRVPGVAILHDFVLHNFFAACFLERPNGAGAYFEIMERVYGPAGREAAAASVRPNGSDWRVREDGPPLWATERVVDFPLFEPVLQQATGIVVHSTFLLDRVRKVSEAPSRRLFLPAAQPLAPGSEPVDLEVPAGRLVLLTVGHVNANKRVRDVVEVLGQHPGLAARVQYVVVGELPVAPHVAALREQIERLGLQGTVRLLGQRSDAELHAWLARADVCVNLRHPIMEGASASLADEMTAGKPVIVTNAGIYAELPENCVVRIEPGREVETLPAVLSRLLDHAAGREALGRRAREFAEAHFGPDRYAAGLMDFIKESGGFAAMAHYAGRVGAVLDDMGVRPDMAIVDTVADISADLLGEPDSSPWKPGPAR